MSELEVQIRFFRQRGAVFVSTKQVADALITHKSLPANAVCLTFADNYEGFYRFAFPILKREKIPATQFVHTGYVGSSVGRPKMTWEQLKEIDRSGLVTIASQTVSHPENLCALSDAQVLKEFRDSKASLEKRLGHSVDQLAYPNGKFDHRIAKLARAAGYRIAYTEECHPAESAKDIYQVARYVHTKYAKAWLDKKSK